MIVLNYPFPPDECLRRLRARTDSFFSFLGHNSMVGGVWGNVFFAQKRESAFTHNSFRPCLKARIEPDGDGSIIYVSFQFHPLVIAWLGIVLTVLIFFDFSWYSEYFEKNTINIANTSAIAGLIAPFGVLLFGAALFLFGWLISSGDKLFLISEVRRAIAGPFNGLQLEQS